MLLLTLLLASPAFGGWVSGHHRPDYPSDIVFLGRSKVKGVIEPDYPSVRQFLGIPYAKPPVGELRWEAPQVKDLPPAVNATAYGRSCSQFVTTVPNMFNTDVLEYNIADANSTGEDCLTLSVWTPQRARKLPVIVFFYGGGWYAGGQNAPYLIPTQWVQRVKDLIVVVPKCVSP